MTEQVTGRHGIEVLFIAATGWTLKLVNYKDVGGFDCIARKMIFKFCYSMDDGPGIYNASFAECKKDYTHCNLVVITLILMERLGMIKSAIDVYNGFEELIIDGRVYETPPLLRDKLVRSQHNVKEKVIAQLKKRGQGQEDDVEDTIDEAVGNSLYLELKNNQDKPGDPTPFYTNNANHGLLSSVRYDPQSEGLREMAEKYGYRPTGSTRPLFGRTGISAASHRDQPAANSAAVRHGQYENADEYRRRIPANLLQEDVDEQAMEALLEEQSLTPAFDDPEFSQRLPHPEPFMEKQQRAPRFLNQSCHFTGCDETFLRLGDLRDHMTTHSINLEGSESEPEGATAFYECVGCHDFHSVNWIRYKNHACSCVDRENHPFAYTDEEKHKKSPPPQTGVAAHNKRKAENHAKRKRCVGAIVQDENPTIDAPAVASMNAGLKAKKPTAKMKTGSKAENPMAKEKASSGDEKPATE